MIAWIVLSVLLQQQGPRNIDVDPAKILFSKVEIAKAV